MKKIITITFLLLVVMACKKENNPLNNIKDAVDNAKEIKQDVSNTSKAAKGLLSAQKNAKRLAKLTPVSKDQIKAWMPEELEDLKRSSFSISKEIGMACKLVFDGDNGKKIKINIIDGAGSGAPMMSMFSVMQNLDIDKETDRGYERTQKMGGQNVYVTYNKSDNYEKSKIQCLVNDRFGIEANAWKMTPEELWEYIQKLEIEKIIN